MEKKMVEGRVTVTKTSLNNARCVVRAIGESFFPNFFIVLMIIIYDTVGYMAEQRQQQQQQQMATNTSATDMINQQLPQSLTTC